MPRQARLSAELGNPVLEGWQFGGTESTLNPHKDGTGAGGVRHVRNVFGGFEAPDSRFFKHGPTAEVYARKYAHHKDGFNSESRIEFYAGAGFTELVSVRWTESDSLLKIYVGGSLAATSVGTLTEGVYHRVEARAFIHDTLGFVEVFVDDDGSYSTPFVRFPAAGTGDTKPGADTQVDGVRIFYNHSADIDDVAVHTIGLEYDGGVGGAPAVGETVTDAGTGGTAVIESVDGDAVSGFLIVSQVSGTFGNNNQITTGGTFDALVNAPTADYAGGLMPHSGFPGDGTIVYLPASANGTTSDLTGSDGNQVDNYLQVDQVPIDSGADYNLAAADGLFDTYGKGTLPAGAVTVKAVETVVSHRKDGTTINNTQHMLRFGGTDYDDDDNIVSGTEALPASYETSIHTWHTKPDGTGAFAVADVNAAGTEPGVKFLA